MQSGKKGRAGKIVAAVAAGLVLLVLVVEMAFYGITGRYLTFENTIYVKNCYTVAADQLPDGAMDRVVATMGQYSLTNGQLQVFYWALANSGDYDMDSYSTPAKQIYDEDTGMTWEQYLLTQALELWQKYQLLSAQAKAENYVLPANYQSQLDSLEEELLAYADTYGFSDPDHYLQTLIGAGCTVADYKYYLELSYTAEMYLQELMADYEPDEAEKEAYFAEHEAELAASGVTKHSDLRLDIRHILVAPEEDTQEAWDSASRTAQLILDRWLAGEKTEESFAALAQEYSADSSASAGGLYQEVYQGQMTEAFNDWCFDESRSSGDHGIVKTEYGYHVMYYVYGAPAWEYYSRMGVRRELADEAVQSLIDENPMHVTYRKIVLGGQE